MTISTVCREDDVVPHLFDLNSKYHKGGHLKI